MRVHFKDSVHPARLSKTIKKLLAERGITIGLRKVQEIVAVMFGYADWHELTKSVDKEPPSLWDDDVEAMTVGARRRQYVSGLTRAGIPKADAEWVVDQSKPTAVRKASVRLSPTTWIYEHAHSSMSQSREWATDVDAFTSSPGYLKLHAVIIEAVESERYWAERWAARLEVPELKDALKAVSSNRGHEMWPALIAAAIADPPGHWRSEVTLDASSPRVLGSALDSLDLLDMKTLANELYQAIPETLASLAIRAENDFLEVHDEPVSPDTRYTGPWQVPSAFALPTVWTDDWEQLGVGDLSHFGGLAGFNLPFDADYAVGFKLARLDDEYFRQIRASEVEDGGEPPQSLAKMLRREDTPTDRTDLIVVSAMRDDEDPIAIGYMVLRSRMLKQGAPTHELNILHAYAESDDEWEATAKAALITAISYPLHLTVEQEWPKVLPPDRLLTLRITPDLDGHADIAWVMDLMGAVRHVCDESSLEISPRRHCIRVKVVSGEEGTSPIALPVLPRIFVPSSLREKWDRLDNILATLRMQLGGPVVVYAAVGGIAEVKFGWPYEELGGLRRIGRDLSSDSDDQESRKALEALVREIESGVFEDVMDHFIGESDEVVLTLINMFSTPAVVAAGTWYADEWEEGGLGISLVLKDRVKESKERARDEDMYFWRSFPDHLKAIFKEREMAAEGLSKGRDFW